jgi:hypothetical protein
MGDIDELGMRDKQMTKVKKSTKATPPKEETKNLKLNLLSNGIDFIQSGVLYFVHDEPDPASHKYAILHLFSGMLLLLKERLRREHPSLIFKEVKDVGRSDARTVDFDEALSRLESCASVVLDEKIKKTLRAAQRLRNQLEHYEFTIDLRHAQAVIGDVSEVAYLFMRDELDEHLETHVQPEVWTRMQFLQGIAKRVEEDEIEDWRSRAVQYVEMDDNDLATLANSVEPYHPKHNPDPDAFLECPECGEETLVQTEDRDIGVCTNLECRQVSEIASCLRCGDRLPGGGMICIGCSDYIDRQ